jgi:hypothetical protein
MKFLRCRSALFLRCSYSITNYAPAKVNQTNYKKSPIQGECNEKILLEKDLNLMTSFEAKVTNANAFTIYKPRLKRFVRIIRTLHIDNEVVKNRSLEKMLKRFEGKKLLILGATANEIPLVKRAQELGAYVITTDYNTDFRKSPAKNVSDEYWNVSWSDIDELEKRCRTTGINGVTAGFSEIRIDNMIKLCERLDLPCYVSSKQLAITRNKALFKAECRRNGVPTINEYESLDAVTRYPVIVKPTDRAGSIGVGIAYDRVGLEEAFKIAYEKSLEKTVIIEDYITDATEFDVHYAVCNGKITLLTTDDIIPASGNQKDGKVVQSAWMYPSKYEKDYLNSVSQNIESMIQNMGILDGTIFFSGFVHKNGEFSFFECGYRLWGEQEFSYDYMCGKMNYLDIYIYHALTGSCADISGNPNGAMKNGVELNLYVTGGTISRIEGIDKIAENRDCYLHIIDSYVGQECTFENAILTKAALIGFANSDPLQLKKDIEEAYSVLHVCDENGKNMFYDHVNTDVIGTWWSR